MKQLIKRWVPSIEFYWGFASYRLLILVVLSLFVGVLDSVGLSLLIPILQFFLMGQTTAEANNPLSGWLQELIQWLGLDYSAVNVVILFLALMCLKAVVKYFSLVYGWKLIAAFNYKIKKSLVDKLFQLDFQEYLRLDTGRVSNILSLEVDRCGVGFQYFVNYLVSFFTALSFLVVLAALAWRFAVSLLVLGLLYFIFLRYINRRVRALSSGITNESAKFNSLFIQVFHAFKYIKATASNHQLNIRLTSIIQNLRDFKFTIMNLQGMRSIVQEPVILVIICVAVFVNVRFLAGEPAAIFLALMLFYRATSYFMMAQNAWGTYVVQSGGTRAVMDLHNSLAANQEPASGHRPVVFEKQLRLEGVSFAYDQGPAVLKGLSFEIPRNATVAFVGKSGSGKSTLINLLTGILKPTAGQIWVDDTPLSEINAQQWRSAIGYVTQEPVVFYDTIRNNITLWQPEDTHTDRLSEALRQAHVEEFLPQPEGVDAMLADRGSNLSGGQRQRLSIGREFYKKPQLIIFDEATSALDAESEAKIQASIEAFSGKVTTIIIAHRLSTIRHADIIFLLDAGTIVASGTFDELLEDRSSGFYEFVRLQTID